MGIDEKTIVITGGGSGIGAEIAREPGGRSVRPVVLDLDLDKPQAVAQGLERIANLVAQGSVVVPPITVITLDEVVHPSNAAPAHGKTVISL